jgi:pSer/pThr/pTyr-binding forkhead associated (FHA) protein
MFLRSTRPESLEMNHDDSAGARLEFSADDEPKQGIPIGNAGIQIGRNPGVGVRFDDCCISRQHARIERHANGAYYLVDTSKNQTTYLNADFRGPKNN